MSVTTTTTSTRPLGVAILAFLVGLFGVLIHHWWTAHPRGGDCPGVPRRSREFRGESGAIWGVIVLIIGLIILGLALGLWHLRMWALVLTLIVVFIEIVSFALAGNYVSLGFVLSLIIFVYLLAVNRHFR